MHVDLGGYHVRDIEFTAAFDIDRQRSGRISAPRSGQAENNTIKFARVPRRLGVKVHRGMTHDGLGKYLSQKITKAPGGTAGTIAGILRETHTDVVVSYLPVGSEQATKWYVEQILDAGCAFVDCIPVFIARGALLGQGRFKAADLPIIGGRHQVSGRRRRSSTARWPVCSRSAGLPLQRTSQLNVGGNMDFYNMLERERLESKKISKTNAVTSIIDRDLPSDDVHVGPSDYVPWLTDRKWAHIRLEGRGLRGRAAESRAQARGVGLAELGGGRDRRGALLQTRAQPWSRRTAGRSLRVPDEVAPQTTSGRGRESRHGAVHRPLRTPPGNRAACTGKARAGPRPGRGKEERVAESGGHERMVAGPVEKPFSIAQVSPYPWEAPHEVNAYVLQTARELSWRGHRVLILAASRSPERVRAARRAPAGSA